MPLGRKPVPTNLRVLQGNRSKRPLPVGEPKPAPKLPRAPEHLTDEAKREWRRTGKRLAALGLMSEIDTAMLAAHCTAWGRWVEAEEMLRKTGPVIKAPSGYLVQSPFIQIANRAMEQVIKTAVEFGMSPSSRSRVTAATKAEEKSKWAGLL